MEGICLHVGLEGSLNRERQVLGLLSRESLKLNVQVIEMETGNLLIKNLGKSVDTNFELSSGLLELGVLVGECLVLGVEQQDLGKGLVGERAGHDE